LTEHLPGSTFEKTAEQARTQSQILETLFPGTGLNDLNGKSLEELLGLLSVKLERAGYPYSSTVSSQSRLPLKQPSSDGQYTSAGEADDSAAVSENGDHPAERRWDESLNHPGSVASDDVNAIGLAQDHHVRSYLGMTSMSAVIRAIFRLYPAAKEHTVQCSKTWSAIPSQPLPAMPFLDRDPALDKLKEQRCIDFYFDHVHAITPLIDEEDFRRQFAAGDRQDASWKGLLNMVFVMGSIASGSDSLHEQYYRQACSFVSLESLGAGNMDSLQALCLLGGYYLHYRNSPNMAYSILGAAHRVAIALGLHREPRQRANITDPDEAARHRQRVELRRRTWWSLFCLDVWGAMTQGRPTCGRWDSSTMDTLFPTASSPDDFMATSLQASSNFCLICDRMQQRFARPGRLSIQEVVDFDTELVRWYDALPPTMTDPVHSPPRFHIAREFMRTRYLNARMLLTRSSFLYVANGHRKNLTQLAPEAQQLLDTCCTVASETIDAIALYWTPNRVHVWNAGWYLFQACMTPLLSLAVDKNMETSATESVAAWRASLGKALETFAEMRPWMRSTDRSPEIVSAFYEALTADYDGAFSTPSGAGSLDLFGWYDDQLSEMDWSTFLGGENMAAYPGNYPAL
jgi:hypothetical protein